MSDPGRDPGRSRPGSWPPPPPPGGSHRGSGPWGAPRRDQAARPRTKSWVWLVAAIVVAVLVLDSRRIGVNTLIVLAVLLPSVILHEVAHGATAFALGDDTARRAGRLTLRPGPHIDIVGTLIVPAITVLSGWGFFGWAKPVPVTVGRLRSPRNHYLLVALAGPATNAALAALAGFVFVALHGGAPLYAGALWARLLYFAGLVNVWLAAFNLLPVPPLDGSVLVERFVPRAWWPRYLRFRQYALPVLLGAILLLSMVRVYPTEPLVNHLATWWNHLLIGAA